MRYLQCSTRTLTEAMPKIDVNQLQRVLQFQAERRRGRLAIIALLHARVNQLCGWNRTSRYSTRFNSWVELAILFYPLWDVPNNAFNCSVRPRNPGRRMAACPIDGIH